jgi:hypothetical protein
VGGAARTGGGGPHDPARGPGRHLGDATWIRGADRAGPGHLAQAAGRGRRALRRAAGDRQRAAGARRAVGGGGDGPAERAAVGQSRRGRAARGRRGRGTRRCGAAAARTGSTQLWRRWGGDRGGCGRPRVSARGDVAGSGVFWRGHGRDQRLSLLAGHTPPGRTCRERDWTCPGHAGARVPVRGRAAQGGAGRPERPAGVRGPRGPTASSISTIGRGGAPAGSWA